MPASKMLQITEMNSDEMAQFVTSDEPLLQQ